jgi:Rrf2 family protein
MAAHALAVLAQSREGYPSAYVASSVNTHAVFLRRILADLVAAGLVQVREGRTGGYRLARPAGKITLADVYRAVEREGPLAPSPAVPNPRCPVGAGMRRAFARTAAAAEDGLVSALAGETIEDLSRRALKRGGTRSASAKLEPPRSPRSLRGRLPRLLLRSPRR